MLSKDSKIIVTGAKGQLGYDCVRELKERGYTNVLGIDIEELDITDENAVNSFIHSQKPKVVIHNAAWTAVDKAELFREKVYAVNALGPKYLAKASNSVGAKMVYISTDYVFPGTGNQAYEVNDPIGPKSIYGLTKYQGEQFVRKLNYRHFIIRISWVFGKNGQNFVKTMLKLAETHKKLSIVSDQIGSPTYTFDLSKLICDMIPTEKYGTYHATNEGYCSWAEFAKKIFELAGKDVIVIPVTTAEYKMINANQADRPLNSRMSKKSLDLGGFMRMPTWQNALERYLREIKGEDK